MDDDPTEATLIPADNWQWRPVGDGREVRCYPTDPPGLMWARRIGNEGPELAVRFDMDTARTNLDRWVPTDVALEVRLAAADPAGIVRVRRYPNQPAVL